MSSCQHAVIPAAILDLQKGSKGHERWKEGSTEAGLNKDHGSLPGEIWGPTNALISSWKVCVTFWTVNWEGDTRHSWKHQLHSVSSSRTIVFFFFIKVIQQLALRQITSLNLATFTYGMVRNAIMPFWLVSTKKKKDATCLWQQQVSPKMSWTCCIVILIAYWLCWSSLLLLMGSQTEKPEWLLSGLHFPSMTKTWTPSVDAWISEAYPCIFRLYKQAHLSWSLTTSPTIVCYWYCCSFAKLKGKQHHSVNQLCSQSNLHHTYGEIMWHCIHVWNLADIIT